jgi:hypothetical protein
VFDCCVESHLVVPQTTRVLMVISIMAVCWRNCMQNTVKRVVCWSDRKVRLRLSFCENRLFLLRFAWIGLFEIGIGLAETLDNVLLNQFIMVLTQFD